jgi:hypothetical protein
MPNLKRSLSGACKWVLLLGLVAVCCAAGKPSSPPKQLFEESFTFVASHDSFTLELKGRPGGKSRHFQVVFAEKGAREKAWLTETELEKWKGGRALRLRFTESEGLELLDPATGRGLPVTRESGEGTQRQPLDRWLEERMQKAETQIELQEASDLATRLWRSEVARLHKLATGRFGHLLTPGERKELQEEAAMWSRFQESQARADRTILKLTSGTRWPLEASQANLQVTRAHALSWAQRLEVLQTAEWERDAEAGPTKRP